MLESVSRKTFCSSSGTYNVRASELARDRERRKTLNATVVFLDNTQHSFQLDKRDKGRVLLELVYQHLDLIEKDYFGLQFTENGLTPSPGNREFVRWLDPGKTVKKQSNGGNFYFRVKFYVSDPSKLQEEYTRYNFYLQIRKDILQGKLLISPSTACLLASYILQSEIGDYQPEETTSNYLSKMTLIPGQTEEMEKKIIELHELHKGQTPADAEFNFLDHVKKLDMYGVDLHRAKDSSGKDLQIGVTACGIVVFQSNIRVNLFSWVKIVKISFKRKQFFIQIRRELSENYDTLLGFNMLTYRSSKNLWKSCVEHHAFFRLHSPCAARKFFHTRCTLGSTFRYSGRTEFQTIEEGRRTRLSHTFYRSSCRNNVQQQQQQLMIFPTTELTDLSHSPSARKHMLSSEKWESRPSWGKQTSEAPVSDEEGGFIKRNDSVIEISRKIGAFSPVLSPRAVITYVDEDLTDSTTDRSHLTPDSLYEAENYNGIASTGEDNVVRIKILPDDQGRYGFNVKGGFDMNMPILISRVAPNTPADRCYPKLNEGDQVLTINNRDISGLEHDQVVALIKSASGFPSSGELILKVKKNPIYSSAADQEEPPYQYVPESPLSSTEKPGDVGDLRQSMLLLADGLASGALIVKFDLLYRKKPGLTCNEARKPENLAKNRYRDVLPYDATRVVLSGDLNGDYINANYVNMEIHRSGIINRYIATQGPMPNTVDDFWQMVYEAQSTLIIMLTTTSEKGRSKCVKYWPALSESIELENQRVLTTIKEELEPSNTYILREFTLLDKTGESRDITQMQYLAWPDHGVPDDINRFLSFTKKVRSTRAGMVEPTVIHCSAGIGRTGVLILMETAMCLIEANEPIYPLDIVQQMRDQRAMMIQTPSQYRFVCSSIHYIYTEGLVQPLLEFIK